MLRLLLDCIQIDIILRGEKYMTNSLMELTFKKNEMTMTSVELCNLINQFRQEESILSDKPLKNYDTIT